MLSKAQNKYIRSLSQQKFRKEYGVFVAEGDKIAREWLNSGETIKHIIALNDWADTNKELLETHPEAIVSIVEEHELEAISGLQTPNKVLLLIYSPKLPVEMYGDEWCLALDHIQDPGNMGTIIRIADWFGIKHIICSPGCVDIYNPKVVQSAMGSHLRVQFHDADLGEFIANTKLPIIAATLEGTDVYSMPRMDRGILVIGNESGGIDPNIIQKASYKVTIPRKGEAESLNASVSAGILCALLVK